MLDLTKIRREYVEDVNEYLVDNEIRMFVEELTPREFLKFWLEWNAIQGYDGKIVALMESLGWTPPKVLEANEQG